MADPIKLRWMQNADLTRVMAIERASFSYPLTLEEFQAIRKPSNVVGFTADYCGRVVGFMLYEFSPSAVELLNLAVDPLFRRMGVGRAMLGRIAQSLTEDKRRRASVTVLETNVRAHLFLRACGWWATRIVRRPWPDCCDDDGIRFTRWHDQEAVDACVLNAIARGGFEPNPAKGRG